MHFRRNRILGWLSALGVLLLAVGLAAQPVADSYARSYGFKVEFGLPTGGATPVGTVTGFSGGALQINYPATTTTSRTSLTTTTTPATTWEYTPLIVTRRLAAGGSTAAGAKADTAATQIIFTNSFRVELDGLSTADVTRVAVGQFQGRLSATTNTDGSRRFTLAGPFTFGQWKVTRLARKDVHDWQEWAEEVRSGRDARGRLVTFQFLNSSGGVAREVECRDALPVMHEISGADQTAGTSLRETLTLRVQRCELGGSEPFVAWWNDSMEGSSASPSGWDVTMTTLDRDGADDESVTFRQCLPVAYSLSAGDANESEVRVVETFTFKPQVAEDRSLW